MYNTTVGLINKTDTSDPGARYTHIFVDSSQREGENVGTEIRLRNSRFSNADHNTGLGGEYNLGVVRSGTIGFWLDNCSVFRGRYDLEVEPPPIIRKGVPLVNLSGATPIWYVSRNIHNYDVSGGDPYSGTWNEISGDATSSVSLGVSGYGMFEQFAMIRPYDYYVG
jgi:hypothetical protein